MMKVEKRYSLKNMPKEIRYSNLIKIKRCSHFGWNAHPEFEYDWIIISKGGGNSWRQRVGELLAKYDWPVFSKKQSGRNVEIGWFRYAPSNAQEAHDLTDGWRSVKLRKYIDRGENKPCRLVYDYQNCQIDRFKRTFCLIYNGKYKTFNNNGDEYQKALFKQKLEKLDV
jgi:hypothetical protein